MKSVSRIGLVLMILTGTGALPGAASGDDRDGLTLRSFDGRVPQVSVPRPARAEAEPAWVSGRVAELQPTAAERKIDRVGWARSLHEAERLARKHNRPVFLFTHDGRMGNGRC